MSIEIANKKIIVLGGRMQEFGERVWLECVNVGERSARIEVILDSRFDSDNSMSPQRIRIEMEPIPYNVLGHSVVNFYSVLTEAFPLGINDINTCHNPGRFGNLVIAEAMKQAVEKIYFRIEKRGIEETRRLGCAIGFKGLNQRGFKGYRYVDQYSLNNQTGQEVGVLVLGRYFELR